MARSSFNMFHDTKLSYIPEIPVWWNGDFQEYSLASLNMKKPMSPTPLKCARRALILALKRFRRGIGQPAVEVVDDGIVMVLKGLDDLAKAIVPKCFHSIVPPCQVKPCHCGGGVFVENVPQVRRGGHLG